MGVGNKAGIQPVGINKHPRDLARSKGPQAVGSSKEHERAGGPKVRRGPQSGLQPIGENKGKATVGIRLVWRVRGGGVVGPSIDGRLLTSPAKIPIDRAIATELSMVAQMTDLIEREVLVEEPKIDLMNAALPDVGS